MGYCKLILHWIKWRSFTWQTFIGGAFLNAIPGIIIQIIIIPIIVIALKRAGFIENGIRIRIT